MTIRLLCSLFGEKAHVFGPAAVKGVFFANVIGGVTSQKQKEIRFNVTTSRYWG